MKLLGRCALLFQLFRVSWALWSSGRFFSKRPRLASSNKGDEPSGTWAQKNENPATAAETSALPLARKIKWRTPELAPEIDMEHVSAASDLRDLDRSIVIVTTAAIPWMTGTAVNPALRAAYLSARGYRNVTLLLPWLEDSEEQAKLFGPKQKFENQDEQAEFVREWCRKNAAKAHVGSDSDLFTIGWYPARYAGGIGSILGTDDITSHIDEAENDIVILEEPEHINWYRNGPRWTSRFRHVIGIAHTNYEAYAATEPSRDGRGSFDAAVERLFTETVTRAHCDVVIQLSATLRPLPHSRVCNVHGVRDVFLEAGHKAAKRQRKKTGKCYFLGKALWAKGYDQLLLLTAGDGDSSEIDCFGDGPNIEEIKSKAEALGSKLNFKGSADHADQSVFGTYDIFVNPSISEVLCTATAEALAMGKSVVISRHPSNEFFYDFENCHVFAPGDREEFARALKNAKEQNFDTSNSRNALDWNAATDRLVYAAALDGRAPPARLALASLVMHSYHWGMTASPLARDLWLTISGAGPHTPWSTRYPAAFKAVNKTEAVVKNAGRALEKASERLKRGDELALAFAKRSERRAFVDVLAVANETNLAPPKAQKLVQSDEKVQRRYYRRWSRLRAAFGRAPKEERKPTSWLSVPDPEPEVDEQWDRGLKLPNQLAARTARAVSQLRQDLEEREMQARERRELKKRDAGAAAVAAAEAVAAGAAAAAAGAAADAAEAVADAALESAEIVAKAADAAEAAAEAAAADVAATAADVAADAKDAATESAEIFAGAADAVLAAAGGQRDESKKKGSSSSSRKELVE